jgi:hypothetical protein
MNRSFCLQCGAQLVPDSRFCGACGTAIANATKPAQAIHDQLASQAPGLSQAGDGRPDNTAVTQSGPYSKLPSVLKSGAAFAVVYMVAMVPTYILPYFGSNSAIWNVAGAAVGAGTLPQFWLHLTFLFMAVVLAWFRGIYCGQAWIAIFPIFAAIFDMIPGFNWLFLIPTMLHMTAIVLGVRGKLSGAEVDVTSFRVACAVLVVLMGASIVQFIRYQRAMHSNAQRAETVPSPAGSPAIAKPQSVVPRPAMTPQQTDALKDSVIGEWHDGGPTCAIVDRYGPKNIKMAIGYCEGFIDSAGPMIGFYRDGAYANESGFKVTVLSPDKWRIDLSSKFVDRLGNEIPAGSITFTRTPLVGQNAGRRPEWWDRVVP